jgi:hypothetical protein
MVQQNKPAQNAAKGGRNSKKVKEIIKVRAKTHLTGGSAPKAVRKATKAGKVIKASAQLVGRVAHPKKFGKMMKDAAKGKGLVLPGSNYIGPGNPMNRKVKSKGDALAKKHDEDYDRYLKAGYSKKKVYGGFSDADKRLMKKSDVTTPEGVATYTGMKAKQLLHKAGLTGKHLKEKNVRKREAKRAAMAAAKK